MSEKNIIVQVGDSWAAGTWDQNSDIPRANEGIGQNFIDTGYSIRNLAKPGGSNLESIDRLKDYLRSNQHEINDIKFILFWKTEFFREIWYYHPDDTVNAVAREELGHNYSALKDQWVYRPYYRLAEIALQWNVPIYVIGGCSDCIWYDEFEKDFPGIKIICQSATNLLLTGDHRIQEPVFCEFLSGWIDRCQFLEKIKQNITAQDLEVLLHDIDLGTQRLKSFRENPQFFGPDGIHPNALAQKLIFEYLIDHVPELSVDHKNIQFFQQTENKTWTEGRLIQ
jgi:hypothetical protein